MRQLKLIKKLNIPMTISKRTMFMYGHPSHHDTLSYGDTLKMVFDGKPTKFNDLLKETMIEQGKFNEDMMSENKWQKDIPELERKWLSNMAKAIYELKLTDKFISSEFNNFYNTNKKMINEHKLVEEDGHSGGSFYWTINNVYRACKNWDQFKK